MSLAGQSVVVVGGASGIGLSVARLANERGAEVTIVDVDASKLARVRADHPKIRTTAGDVTVEASMKAAFHERAAIDHVYVSAGTTKLGGILDADVSEQLAPLVLRLWGNVHVIRAAASKVRAGGSFTFTGGISTDRPVPGAWVSSVATAAAEQLARAMAIELAPIRFNAVAPGWTDTPMWDGILGEHKAKVFEDVAAKQLTGRLSRPEETAEAVLFLMSTEAVTGEVLHVDGGGRLV
ncbi:MAG: SDR family oxidoreductase [Myxococcales bacterium]|nr:SDR family oxidoreductase [Myxococcales bacterium]